MQLTHLFAAVGLGFTMLCGVVSAGNCTRCELDSVGFVEKDPGTDVLRLLKKSTEALTTVGKASVAFTAPKHEGRVTKSVTKEFEKAGVPLPGGKCLPCFVRSTQCAAKHCKAKCMTDNWSDGCRGCLDEHCRADFETCVGEPVLNPFDYRDELRALA